MPFTDESSLSIGNLERHFFKSVQMNPFDFPQVCGKFEQTRQEGRKKKAPRLRGFRYT